MRVDEYNISTTELFYKFLNYRNQMGNVILDSIPQFVRTNFVIIMDKYVTHTLHHFPWCYRMRIPIFPGQFIGCLANNLHKFHITIESDRITLDGFERILTLLVNQQLARFEDVLQSPFVSNRFSHISKSYRFLQSA